MVDTNSDPRIVEFPIPSNDDASKSISLIVNEVCDAIEEGLGERRMEKEKEAASKEKEAQKKVEEAEGLAAKESEAVLEKIKEVSAVRKAKEAAAPVAEKDPEKK
jgi:small subunit ribosomal protein S2